MTKAARPGGGARPLEQRLDTLEERLEGVDKEFFRRANFLLDGTTVRFEGVESQSERLSS